VDRITVLALRAKTGDKRALETFVATTRQDVFNVCRYLGSPTDPDDLTQETFERALRAIHSYRGDGAARSWLLSIARRVCIDATRANIRGRDLMERSQSVNPPEHVQDHSWVEIDELLGGLSDDRREAFVLTQMVGLSYQEAAEVAGCPIGTIRSRVARARRDLLSDEAVRQAFTA
jgi:RNA polymerase sigma-70 factor (ECF subfamily)